MRGEVGGGQTNNGPSHQKFAFPEHFVEWHPSRPGILKALREINAIRDLTVCPVFRNEKSNGQTKKTLKCKVGSYEYRIKKTSRTYNSYKRRLRAFNGLPANDPQDASFANFCLRNCGDLISNVLKSSEKT